MGFLAQLGVVVLTQSVARKPFHDKCNIKKPTKNKAFSLNLATLGLARRRRNVQLQMTIIRGILTSSDGSTTLGLYEPGVLGFLELVNVLS